MNADVFWQQDIFDILKEEERDVLLLADSSIARLEGGDYFFGVADNKIVKYGKELAREIRTHEYVGVGRIRPAFLPHFRKMLHTLMEAEQYTSWWEDVLYQLSTDYDVFVRDVAGHFWAEVDYIEDYERIMAYIYERNAKAAAK